MNVRSPAQRLRTITHIFAREPLIAVHRDRHVPVPPAARPQARAGVSSAGDTMRAAPLGLHVERIVDVADHWPVRQRAARRPLEDRAGLPFAASAEGRWAEHRQVSPVHPPRRLPHSPAPQHRTAPPRVSTSQAPPALRSTFMTSASVTSFPPRLDEALEIASMQGGNRRSPSHPAPEDQRRDRRDRPTVPHRPPPPRSAGEARAHTAGSALRAHRDEKADPLSRCGDNRAPKAAACPKSPRADVRKSPGSLSVSPRTASVP